MQSENPGIENQYRTMSIVWFALLVSQFIFLGILFFIKPELFKFNFSGSVLGGENSIAIIALAVLGITTFLMSFTIKAKFLKQSIDNQDTGLVQTAMIVACAICESISLLGFVIALAFSYQYFFLWFALGILGIILHYPRRQNLIAASYKIKEGK